MIEEKKKVEEHQTKKSDGKNPPKGGSKVNKTLKRTVTPYKGIEGKMLLVRVGTEDHPATTKQIEEIKDEFNSFLEDNGVNCMVFVTHHAVTVDIIGN